MHVTPTRGDGLLNTPQAGKLVGRSPATIRSWRHRRYTDGQGISRPYLEPQGLDERGNPLHTRQAVREAERLVRENGLKASGIDPRRLCHTASRAA